MGQPRAMAMPKITVEAPVLEPPQVEPGRKHKVSVAYKCSECQYTSCTYVLEGVATDEEFASMINKKLPSADKPCFVQKDMTAIWRFIQYQEEN